MIPRLLYKLALTYNLTPYDLLRLHKVKHIEFQITTPRPFVYRGPGEGLVSYLVSSELILRGQNKGPWWWALDEELELKAFLIRFQVPETGTQRLKALWYRVKCFFLST
jgi:hypothetical protein